MTGFFKQLRGRSISVKSTIELSINAPWVEYQLEVNVDIVSHRQTTILTCEFCRNGAKGHLPQTSTPDTSQDHPDVQEVRIVCVCLGETNFHQLMDIGCGLLKVAKTSNIETSSSLDESVKLAAPRTDPCMDSNSSPGLLNK